MKMRRSVIPVVAAVLASFCVSCGLVNITDLTENSAVRGSEDCPGSEAEEYDFREYETIVSEFLSPGSPLPSLDLKGDVFTVVSGTVRAGDPEDLSDVISRAEFLAYRQAENMTGSKIVCSYEEPDRMAEELTARKKTGLPYSDLVIVPGDRALALAASGLLADITEYLPGQDYGCLYPSSAEAVTGNGSVYAVSGSALVKPRDIPAVFLNCGLVSKDPAEISDMVRNRLWTWDELIALLEETERGTYATPFGREYIYSLAFISSGNSYITVTGDGVPGIGFSGESAGYAVGVIRKLYKAKQYGSSTSSFYSSKTGVMIDRLSALEDGDMYGLSWAVAPMPLASEGAEYRTLMERSSPVFAVPSFGCGAEVSCGVMVDLCAAFRGTVYGKYLDMVLSDYALECGAVDCIELVIKSPVFDFAEVNGENIPEAADATYRLIGESVWTDSWHKKLNELTDRAVAAIADGLRPTPPEADESE